MGKCDNGGFFRFIASCDLEFGLLCKLNFAQSFLIRFCMIYAYTRPRYKVSVYRIIGRLVSYFSSKT